MQAVGCGAVVMSDICHCFFCDENMVCVLIVLFAKQVLEVVLEHIA